MRGTWGQCWTCCLTNILQNVAHTTYQKPSPVSPAISSPSHTTETGRSTGSSTPQTPSCGGRVGRAGSPLAHLAGEAELGAKPQRRFCQPPQATTGLGPKAHGCPPATQAVTWAQTLAEHLLHARRCVNYCEQQNKESTVPTLSRLTVEWGSRINTVQRTTCQNERRSEAWGAPKESTGQAT